MSDAQRRRNMSFIVSRGTGILVTTSPHQVSCLGLPQKVVNPL